MVHFITYWKKGGFGKAPFMLVISNNMV